MFEKYNIFVKCKGYVFFFPIIQDYIWICSSQNERIRWVKLNLWCKNDVTLKKVSAPFAHYFSNRYVDACGLEILHGFLWRSHAERRLDRKELCSHPIRMVVLFFLLKNWVQHGMGQNGIAWDYLLVMVVVVCISQNVVMEYLNRRVLCGMLFPSHLKFEAWAILLAWQKREHPWHAATLHSDALSRVLLECVLEIKTQSALGSNEYAGDACSYAVSSLEYHQQKYRKQMKVFCVFLAAVYYFILVGMSVDWVMWIMQPLTSLEQQWVGSDW